MAEPPTVLPPSPNPLLPHVVTAVAASMKQVEQYVHPPTPPHSLRPLSTAKVFGRTAAPFSAALTLARLPSRMSNGQARCRVRNRARRVAGSLNGFSGF